MSAGELIRQTFPSYAELSPEQQASPGYLAQHHENPPTIRMKLEDAVREARQVRGIYELSMPTIAAPTCFKYGREMCQWLGREPDWRKGHRTSQDCALYLYEVTPVEDERGFFNLRWKIEIVGEAEQRAAFGAQVATRNAVTWRLQRAG
jgi:hypothetical protein